MARALPTKVKSTLLHVRQKNGETYVFEKKALYDPEKKCARAQGVRLIGKILPGQTEMVPIKTPTPDDNENSLHRGVSVTDVCPPAASMKIAGSTALLMMAAKTSTIVSDLRSVFGAQNTDAILSFAFFSLLEDSSIADFNAWAEAHEHPFGKTLSDADQKALSATLYDTKLIDAFFQARLKRTEGEDLIVYLSSVERQVSDSKQSSPEISVFKSVDSGLPVALKRVKLPLNTYTFEDLLSSCRVRPSVTLVANESRAEKVNFLNLHRCGLSFVIPVSLDLKSVNEAWNEYKDFYGDERYCLREPDTYARSVPVALAVNQETGQIIDTKVSADTMETLHGYLHFFKSAKRSEEEVHDFYSQLQQFEEAWLTGKRDEKSPLLKFFKGPPAKEASVPLERDRDEIHRALLTKGCLALLTNRDLNAEEALRLYEGIDMVNLCFAKKPIESIEDRRREVSKAVTASEFIHFVSYTILNELIERLREGENCGFSDNEKLSVCDILRKFEDIRLIRVLNYPARFGKITEEERRVADWLGFPTLFDSVPFA